MDSEAGMQQEHHEYRVVYRDADTVRGFGRLVDVTPTRRTLDPFLSRLLLAGVARGELLLVDAASRRVVARLDVRPRRRRA